MKKMTEKILSLVMGDNVTNESVEEFVKFVPMGVATFCVLVAIVWLGAVVG